ncbi:hypothetical protein GX48_03572 [Paracoccidioides brasiliensis]|nr:hypothetical protein GX48_03572 [Paracoccidioides brasiliensis]
MYVIPETNNINEAEGRQERGTLTIIWALTVLPLLQYNLPYLHLPQALAIYSGYLTPHLSPTTTASTSCLPQSPSPAVTSLGPWTVAVRAAYVICPHIRLSQRITYRACYPPLPFAPGWIYPALRATKERSGWKSIVAIGVLSHGMFRLLPWSSVAGGNKVTAEEVKMLAAPQRRSSIADNPALHKLKRKRANSGETDTSVPEPTHLSRIYLRPQEASGNAKLTPSQPPSSVVKVQSPDRSTQGDIPRRNSLKATSQIKESGDMPPPNTVKPDPEPTPPAGTVPKMDTETLRQTLESQLSLEILLKHDELRLIDQEMGKCQVALDQLRRCSEIPYPGSNVAGLSSNVSSGTGSAVLPIRPGPPPISPSPWGVTEGPYSRHYAKWLLPDPRFDGGEVESAVHASAVSGSGADGRTTRASWSEPGVTGTLRSQRSSAGTKLQALSSGYPQPKDKAGPMIIKRKSDGQLVKLVCLDCRRDNFSSTQGFINHCRIAHNRNFASHDAAAAASGEPVEVDEAGMVIGNNNDVPAGTAAGYVHPLIRSAHLVGSAAQPGMRRAFSQGQLAKRSGDSSTSCDGSNQAEKASSSQSQSTPNLNKPQLQKISVVPLSPSFKASPVTPNLSSLMQRRGMSVDLLDIVDDALTKTVMAMLSSDDEFSEGLDDENEQPNHDRSRLSVRGSRLPARTIVSPSQPPRPGSRKGIDKPSRKPQPSPIPPTPTPQRPSYRSPYSPTTGSLVAPGIEHERCQGNDIDSMVDTISSELSPNTVESNQAPSLVSDDEDYEAPSESESPSPSPSAVSDEGPDNIEVQDGDDGTTGGANVPTTATSDAKPGPEITSPSKHHHDHHHPSPVSREVPVYKRKASSKVKGGVKNAEMSPSTNTATMRVNNKEPKRVSFGSPITTTPAIAQKDGGKKQRRG